MESAYLGVGIDEYGNFTNFLGTCGFCKNAISVAGSADTYWEIIATTGAFGVSDWDSSRTRPSETSSYYQQLFVVLQPVDEGGYDVTVYLRAGDASVPTEILATTTTEIAPDTLKLGFAASTGALTNVHEVGEVGFQPIADRDLADVAVDLSADVDEVDPGDTITYTLEVSNRWAEDVNDVALTVDLDETLDDVTWTCLASEGATCPADSGTGDPSATLDIGSGASLTFVITGTVSYYTADPLVATATAAITDSYVDLAPVDNTGTVSTTVNVVDGGSDGDVFPDDYDLDDDNDGILDFTEPAYGDLDGDGTVNEEDLDTDGDGVSDTWEAGYGDYDADDDGRIDGDVTDDGIPEAIAEGDGTIDCAGPVDLLENAGFEDPYVSGFGFVDQESVPGWSTTDPTGEIELWGVEMGVSLLEGAQFAELNANYSSELYQEVETEAGVEYVLVVGHRGRAGEDTARFLLDSVEMDTYTDNTDAWGVYISTFTGTGATTRIGFEAVSTATGDESVGNFFDVIGVYESCDLPDWDEDGTPDHIDTDDDGDGLLTIDEDADGDGDPRNDDTDGDGDPNYLDLDADGDGVTDADETGVWGTDPTSDDTDGDGLTDGEEISDVGSSPTESDTDGDGLDDGAEVLTHETDPTNSDTDGDTLSDGEEVDDTGTDPLDADTDDDGLGDATEISETGTDANDPDTDGDGLSDGDEVDVFNTDPLDTDTDDDGLTDGDEINTYTTDPLDTDTDGDTLSDGDEVNTTGTDPTDVDTDDDGLNDGDEGPTYGTDPTNADTDGDGLTDGGEVVDHGTDPTNADTDGDTLNDGDEVQDYGTDPTNTDSDGDALTDGDEVNTTSTDPTNADTDGDTLSDGDEVNTTGSDPNDTDTDDDGLGDGDEVNGYGTDPNDTDTDDGGVPDGTEVTDGTDPLDPADDDTGAIVYKGGCACSSAGEDLGLSASLLGITLGALVLRRRQAR